MGTRPERAPKAASRVAGGLGKAEKAQKQKKADTSSVGKNSGLTERQQRMSLSQLLGGEETVSADAEGAKSTKNENENEFPADHSARVAESPEIVQKDDKDEQMEARSPKQDESAAMKALKEENERLTA